MRLGSVRVGHGEVPFQPEMTRTEPAADPRPAGLPDQRGRAAIGRDRDGRRDLASAEHRMSCVEADDAAVADDRPADPGPLEDLRLPSRAGVADDQVVEERTAQPDPREAVGPGDLGLDDAPTRGGDPEQPDRVITRIGHLVRQAQSVEDGPALGAEVLAAKLVAGELARVEQGNAYASTGEPQRQRGPGEPRAGDRDVERSEE